MVFLGGIVILERADLHEEFLAAAALDLRDALHRFSRAFVGVVDTGLVLAAAVVALPVGGAGIVDLEEQRQDVPIARLRRVEDDLDRLRMAWVVAVRRVFVLPTRVPDAGS